LFLKTVVHRGVLTTSKLRFSFVVVYLKSSFRHNPSIKDIAPYYRLVESYRNETDRVCHRTLLNIGFWSDASREQKDKVVTLLGERYKNELTIFEETDEQVLAWVNQFWNDMIAKKKRLIGKQ
jgi:predicted Fe-S protein YdhL (DUF1289 family)